MRKHAKQTTIIILITLLIAVVFWIADAVYEYYFFVDNFRLMLFEEPLSFADTLYRNIPPESLFVRITFLIVCLVSGGLSSWYLYTRGKAEEKVRESEINYRTLFETAKDAIFLMNGNSFLDCNSSAVTLFGCDNKNDLLKHSPWEFSPEKQPDGQNSREKAIKYIESALDGNPQQFYWKHTLKNRTPFDAEVSLNGFVQFGKPLLQAIVRDITEKRRTERIILERQRYLEGVLSAAPDAIVALDKDNRIVDWNPGAERLFGHHRHEAIGKNIDKLIAVGDAYKEASRFSHQISHGVPIPPTETTRYRKDGSPVHLIVAGAPIILNQELMGMVAVYTDISDQKQAEKERAKLEEKFYQAQKLESIGRLAGGIAHDLNNMLSPIIGYGEMMLDELDSKSEHVEFVNEIINAATRSRDMVSQLLAFSRKQALRFQPINLNLLLKNFEKLLRRTIREDIKINIISEKSNPTINGDPGQLEQVIMNLAVNAQDAMPDGGTLTIQIQNIELGADSISMRRDVQPGQYVFLTVQDTGQGIDPKIRKHVFEPFYTTKEKHEGTGLGLATAYGIIKQHLGHIWFHSEPNKGTTFNIYLPVKKTNKNNFQTGPLPIIPTDKKGDETILVVEDDENVRKLVVKILRKNGYHVLIAHHGKDAMELLDQMKGKLHLLLTDVIMPEMDGKELYKQITIDYPDVKVIFMSGYSDSIIAGKGIVDHAHFIQKPFPPSTLLSKIREVLDN